MTPGDKPHDIVPRVSKLLSDEQFNLGHWSFAYRISSMVPCK